MPSGPEPGASVRAGQSVPGAKHESRRYKAESGNAIVRQVQRSRSHYPNVPDLASHPASPGGQKYGNAWRIDNGGQAVDIRSGDRVAVRHGHSDLKSAKIEIGMISVRQRIVF